MKRKWERIVNRGYDPLPNSPLSAGIGGVALDGLKEGVRKIAAGFGDFSGVIQELESSDKDSSNPHTPRENTNASNARAKRTGSEHLSTSSMSSIPESMHASDHVLDGEEGEAVTMAMAMTVATAPSLARAASLNSRMHKRASRVAKEPTTPTSASVSSPAHSPRSSNLDVGMSLVLAPSPTLVPFPSSAVPTPASVIGSAHGPVPTTAGPMSSWMDSMGKKLSGIQKGQTYVRRLGTSLLTLTFFLPPRLSRQVLEEPETSVVALGGRLQHAQLCPLARTDRYHTRTCTGPDADGDGHATDLVYDDTSFDVSRIDQVVPDIPPASVLQDHDGLVGRRRRGTDGACGGRVGARCEATAARGAYDGRAGRDGSGCQCRILFRRRRRLELVSGERSGGWRRSVWQWVTSS